MKALMLPLLCNTETFASDSEIMGLLLVFVKPG